MQATLRGWELTPKPAHARPWTTYLLMLAVVAVMVAEMLIWRQGLDLASFLHSYGLVSADFSWTDPQSYLTLVTFNFLHSGGHHFAGNALIMLLAGVAVERYAGTKATLTIWMAGGIVGGLAHLMIFPDASRSLVGASGAISALLGAAIVIGWGWALPAKLWPGRRVLFHIRLPAVCGIWVAFQIYGALQLYSGSIASPTVATWVHLAGFAFGAVAAAVLLVTRQRDMQPVPAPRPLAASGD